MYKDPLLEELTALDFAAVDLNLYLDTHPQDKNAIKEYNKILHEANIVRKEYEKQCGPLSSFRSLSPNEKFIWVNSPWPWESN